MMWPIKLKNNFILNLSKNNLIIDISLMEVKWIVLSVCREKYTIEYYDVEQLVETDGGITKALQHLVDRYTQSILTHPMTIANVIMAIPESILMIKKLVLDKISDPWLLEEIVIQFIEQSFSHAIAELYFDYVLLHDLGLAQDKMQFMVLAAQRQQISPWLDIVEGARLHLNIVDVDQYAWLRGLIFMLDKNGNSMMKQGVIAVVHQYQQVFQLTVIYQEMIIFTYAESYTDDAIREDILSLLERFKVSDAFKAINFLVLATLYDIELIFINQLQEIIKIPIIRLNPSRFFVIDKLPNTKYFSENPSDLLRIAGLAERVNTNAQY